MILLTDGQTADRNLVLPKMREARGTAERLPCTVSTFGFGYNIDSPLLVEMALEASGVYSFIPDAGFVGTVFVNHISNLLTTMALSAALVLAPEDGVAEIHEVYGGLNVMDDGSGQKRIDLATIQYGQTKDVVVRMSLKSPEDYLTARASFEIPGGTVEETELAEATATDRPDMEKVALERWRLCFAKAMEEAVATAGPGGSEEKRAEAFQLLSALAKEISDDAAKGNYASTQYLMDLQTDLSGEATAAVADRAAFVKWGRHFLPSLMFAHRRQMCNNFKDPGVQHYGGKMFQDIQQDADEKFNELPPPKPSRRSYGYSGSAPAVRSMAAYNDASAG